MDLFGFCSFVCFFCVYVFWWFFGGVWLGFFCVCGGVWVCFYFFHFVLFCLSSAILLQRYSPIQTVSVSLHLNSVGIEGREECFDEKINVLPVKMCAGVPFAVNAACDFDGYSLLPDGGGWYEHKRIDYKTGAGLEVVSI